MSSLYYFIHLSMKQQLGKLFVRNIPMSKKKNNNFLIIWCYHPIINSDSGKFLKRNSCRCQHRANKINFSHLTLGKFTNLLKISFINQFHIENFSNKPNCILWYANFLPKNWHHIEMGPASLW